MQSGDYNDYEPIFKFLIRKRTTKPITELCVFQTAKSIEGLIIISIIRHNYFMHEFQDSPLIGIL